MWACVFDVCGHVVNASGYGCVVIYFNACGRVVIDFNACGRVVMRVDVL